MVLYLYYGILYIKWWSMKDSKLDEVEPSVECRPRCVEDTVASNRLPI